MLTSDQMELYEKNLYLVMNERYKKKATKYQEIFSLKPDATGAGDKNTQILGADKFRKKSAQGQGFQFRSPVQGWQTLVSYETFFDAVKFDKEEVEDNVKNGEIGKTLNNYASSWGEAYRVTKEEYSASFFNEGGYTSGDIIFNGSWGDNTDASGNYLYDSKPFFNLTGNTRTTKDGSTYYNARTTTALNETNFGTLYDLMAVTNAKTEVGTNMENKPNMILTQEGSDYREAWKIINTSGQNQSLPGSELNDRNPWEGKVKPLDWAYLSGGAWYLLEAKCEELQFDDRQKPVVEFYRNKETRGYMATVDSRFAVHLKAGVWKKIVRDGGSFAATG